MNRRGFTKRELKAGSLNGRQVAELLYATVPTETFAPPAGFIRDSLGVLTPKRHITAESDWKRFFRAVPR